jgi:hypothetical protein
VRFARATVIIEAVGDVDILLELEQRQVAVDRVDGARRNEEEIADADSAPVYQPFD